MSDTKSDRPFKLTLVLDNNTFRSLIDATLYLVLHYVKVLSTKYDVIGVEIITTYPKIHSNFSLIKNVTDVLKMLDNVVMCKNPVHGVIPDCISAVNSRKILDEELFIVCNFNTQQELLDITTVNSTYKMYCSNVQRHNAYNKKILCACFGTKTFMSPCYKGLIEHEKLVELLNIDNNTASFDESYDLVSYDSNKLIKILNDIRYLYDLTCLNINHAKIIKQIENVLSDLRSIHSHYLSRILRISMDLLLKKHSHIIHNLLTNDNSIESNSSNNSDIKDVHSILRGINYISKFSIGNTRKYAVKNVDSKICERIEEVLDKVIEETDDLNLDSDPYKTLLTMSNWIDEVRSGGCIGLAMNVTVLFHKKGCYNVVMNDVPIVTGSTTEMFGSLQMENSDKQINTINMNNVAIIQNTNGSDSYNCIIPLYIHSSHWKIAKIYLNPICNIIMYDSINMNNPSAWKLIYTLLINFGKELIHSASNISIQYFFSLWLTTTVLSKEYGFVSGLSKFIKNIKTDNKSDNVDFMIILGQILSMCVINGNDVNDVINMLCEQTVTNTIRYHDIETYIDNSDTTELEGYVRTMGDDIFDSIRFALMFLSFVKSESLHSIVTELKENYGIPSINTIEKFKSRLLIIQTKQCELTEKKINEYVTNIVNDILDLVKTVTPEAEIDKNLN